MASDMIEAIAGGLAGRLRSLVLVQDRLDRLESGSGQWRAQFATAELEESATQLTLRSLQTISDPINYAILSRLASTDTHTIPALVAEVGIGQLMLSERLNDMIQVGLAMRLIDTNHAQITAAGAGLVRLVDQLSGRAQALYRAKND